MEKVEVGILGPLIVERAGGAVELRSPTQAAVLAALATEPNQVVTNERLIRIVWERDSTDRLEHSLHQHVSGLRRALEPGRPRRSGARVLVTERNGYSLRASVDLQAFNLLAASASSAMAADEWDVALERMEEALRVWRGPALADVRSNSWFEAAAARLDDQRASLQEAAVDLLLQRGDDAEAISRAEVLLDRHPFRERSWGQLMIALYRSGRQADALAAYARARAALVDELGVEPGPELRRLEERVLAHDSTLLASQVHNARDVPAGGEAGLLATYRGDGPSIAGALHLSDGQVIFLDETPTRIGRDPSSDVRLAASRVSRFHAEVLVRDGDAVIRDLESTNGTLVGGTKIQERVLVDGDLIDVGGVRIIYRS